MSDYVAVSAIVTDLEGIKHTVYAGSVEAWAWDDKRARETWKKAYRPVVLDSLGTCGQGYQVAWSAELVTDEDVA